MGKPQVYITHGDKTLSLMGWSRETGIPVTVLRTRYFAGWDTTRMLTEPVHPKATITRAQADEIRMLKGRADPDTVAAKYGITRPWLNTIWRGHAWK